MADDVLEKCCSKCAETKLISHFSRDKRNRDGLCGKCKECSKADNVKWRLANLDRARASSAAWAKNNVEKANAIKNKWAKNNVEKKRAASLRWNIANPEKIMASSVKWRSAHPEMANAATAKWNKAHPEIVRIYKQNRRASKRASGGRLSSGLAAKLFKLQRGKCACGCKQPLGDDYHMDHVIPLALGGSNTDDNIQLLRKLCNLQKSAKHPIDFMQSRGYLL